MKLSFVIPCYNSENTIEMVVNEILDFLFSRSLDDYEIILVNDYSPDHVWTVIQKLSLQNDKIKGVSMAKNFGQHAALLAGYSFCRGDYIISLDDDGQTPVEETGLLLDKLEEGYDVVYAYYYEIKQSKFRRFGTWMSKKMGEYFLGQPKDFNGSSFYIARSFVIKEMIQYKNAYPYLGGLVLRTTRNIACVPTHHRTRAQGHSGYSFKKLLSLWINGVTSFSVKPLEIGISVGAIVALAGFIYAIITIVRRIVDANVPAGWSSMISIMLILGGMILIMLGLVGEYVGRIYISINNTPQYIIREKTQNLQKEE